MAEQLYADVAVITGQRAEGAFTYAVPEGLALRRGMAVAVPWRTRFAAGIVTSVRADTDIEDPREIIRLLDERPLLDGPRLELAQWLSERYLAPLSACIALFLPPGSPRRAVADSARLRRIAPPPAVPPLLLRLAVPPGEARAEMREWPRTKRSKTADLLVLLARGAWTLRAARRIAGGPRALDRWTSPLVQRDGDVRVLTEPASEALDVAHLLRLDVSSRHRAALLREVIEQSPIDEAEARARSLATKADVDRLEWAGWIERVEADPAPVAGRAIDAPLLTPAQSAAVAEIAAAFDEPAPWPFLLHGVTGSGKTEVYLAAIDEALRRGGSALVLVPEISLAPQTVRRIEARFPGLVAVQHSQMRAGEAREAWRSAAAGEARIVVGARSALFAPLPRLALIVVDEAHEWTYKQSEPVPRYDARAAAAELARLSGAVAVFGTATPPVEMHHLAAAGEMRRLVLDERVRADPAAVGRVSPVADPPIEVVDLRAELRAGNRSPISRSLDAALSAALERGEQALLFLNRRGLGSVICRACGAAVECRRCSLAMTAHARGAWLECHECGERAAMPGCCPSCGDSRLRPMRFGTEQLERDVRSRWPGVGAIRWDRDAAAAAGGHERILDEFAGGKSQVLIGTQMIAKGLDLPLVTVSAVINADLSLRAPDYAAAERSFQLITQVAGRAGRGERGGRVIVQTYSPDHHAVIAAAARDYDGFAAAELRMRARFDYPPFGRLAVLRSSHRTAEEADRAAAAMAGALRRQRAFVPSPPELIGPVPARPERVRGRHRRRIILRGGDPRPLLRRVEIDRAWSVDIDPASLA